MQFNSPNRRIPRRGVLVSLLGALALIIGLLQPWVELSFGVKMPTAISDLQFVPLPILLLLALGVTAFLAGVLAAWRPISRGARPIFLSVGGAAIAVLGWIAYAISGAF